MKNIETIKANLVSNKEFNKNLAKLRYYDTERFISDAEIYLNATKERRMFCIIHSVSKSGMSRTLSFHSCEIGDKGAYYRNFNCLFIALGYSETKDGYFRINGCGMDMVFNTNYNIIHDLKRLGFIDKDECENLAQITPVKF